MRVIHRELQSRLDRLGTAVRKVCTGRATERADLLEFSAEVRHLSIKVVRPAKMDELIHLLRYCGDDVGVTVARRAHRDARVAVEEYVSVRVLDPDAVGALDD